MGKFSYNWGIGRHSTTQRVWHMDPLHDATVANTLYESVLNYAAQELQETVPDDAVPSLVQNVIKTVQLAQSNGLQDNEEWVATQLQGITKCYSFVTMGQVAALYQFAEQVVGQEHQGKPEVSNTGGGDFVNACPLPSGYFKEDLESDVPLPPEAFMKPMPMQLPVDPSDDGAFDPVDDTLSESDDDPIKI